MRASKERAAAPRGAAWRGAAWRGAHNTCTHGGLLRILRHLRRVRHVGPTKGGRHRIWRLRSREGGGEAAVSGRAAAAWAGRSGVGARRRARGEEEGADERERRVQEDESLGLDLVFVFSERDVPDDQV